MSIGLKQKYFWSINANSLYLPLAIKSERKNEIQIQFSSILLIVVDLV